jgi:hypothetical protein
MLVGTSATLICESVFTKAVQVVWQGKATKVRQQSWALFRKSYLAVIGILEWMMKEWSIKSREEVISMDVVNSHA